MKFFVTFDTSFRDLYVLFDQLDKSTLFIYLLSISMSMYHFYQTNRDRVTLREFPDLFATGNWTMQSRSVCLVFRTF